jgi:hypothetical protein
VVSVARGRLPKRRINKLFPYQVAVPAPDLGFGKQYSDMLRWVCVTGCDHASYEDAGSLHMCFADAETAVAFRTRFGGGLVVF